MKKNIYILAFAILFFTNGNGQDKTTLHVWGVSQRIPFLNSTHFYNHESISVPNSLYGFLGIGWSIFYKHNKNKISLVYEVPAFLNYQSFSTGKSINIFINPRTELFLSHRIYKNLSVLGGINYIVYNIYRNGIIPQGTIKYKDNTIGITTGIELSPKKFFSVELRYEPAIYTFDTKAYRHLITLDLCFNINVIKYAQRRNKK